MILFFVNYRTKNINESIILGSPISAQGVRSEISLRTEALKRMISKLNLIDPHQAFVLLKNSFAIPKLTYLMRSAPAFLQADLLHEFDSELRNAMSQITNIDFTEESWTQASLPTRAGGLGIRKSVDIALPCFISSALSISTMVEAIISSVTDSAPFTVST